MVSEWEEKRRVSKRDASARTASILKAFAGLPIEHKQGVLDRLGDHIRELTAVGKYPRTTAALQSLYDVFYLDVQQVRADLAFTRSD